MVRFSPRLLYPRGKPLPPQNRWDRALGVSLDDIEKRNFLSLPGLELLSVGHPARIQSLYRLRYYRSTEKYNELIGNRTSDLRIYGIVFEPDTVTQFLVDTSLFFWKLPPVQFYWEMICLHNLNVLVITWSIFKNGDVFSQEALLFGARKFEFACHLSMKATVLKQMPNVIVPGA
jgi:hypothetical protein